MKIYDEYYDEEFEISDEELENFIHPRERNRPKIVAKSLPSKPSKHDEKDI